MGQVPDLTVAALCRWVPESVMAGSLSPAGMAGGGGSPT